MIRRCLVAAAVLALAVCACAAATDYAAQRKAMVDRQLKARGIKDSQEIESYRIEVYFPGDVPTAPAQ